MAPSDPSDRSGIDSKQSTERARAAATDFAENLLWRAMELAATAVIPAGLGPAVVRCLYVGRQVVIAARGVEDGRGFDLKISLPGLDLLEDSILPPGFELVAHVRIGQALPDPDGAVDIRPEIQIFKPWFDDVDVGSAAKPREASPQRRIRMVGPVEVSEPEPDPNDPWTTWIVVLGDSLIHNLAETLGHARTASANDLRSAILEHRLGPDHQPSRSASDTSVQEVCSTDSLQVELQPRESPRLTGVGKRPTADLSPLDGGNRETVAAQAQYPDGDMTFLGQNNKALQDWTREEPDHGGHDLPSA
jgi:hypothetical protein